MLLMSESFLNKAVNDEKLKEKSCYSCVRTIWKAASFSYITFTIRTKTIQDNLIISDKVKKEAIKDLNLYRDRYLKNQIKPIFPNPNEYSLFDAEIFTESTIKTKKYFRTNKIKK